MAERAKSAPLEDSESFLPEFDGQWPPQPSAAALRRRAFSAASRKQPTTTAAVTAPPALNSQPVAAAASSLQQQQNRRRRPTDDALYDGDSDVAGELALLEEATRAPAASLEVLRRIGWASGVSARVRPLVWRLLLGLLPTEICERIDFRAARREAYAALLATHAKTLTEAQHKQIDVDVARTHPMGFGELFALDCVSEMLRRVLALWSATHADAPFGGYFQGLNELPTPFVVVFLRELFGQREIVVSEVALLEAAGDLQSVEADCYFALCEVTEQLRPYCSAAMASSRLHSEHMALRVRTVLRCSHRALAAHLERNGVLVEQFAVRWTLCLMLRELPLRDSLLVWDAAICDPRGPCGFSCFMVYVCVAYLLQFAGLLLAMDADSALLFLHSPPFLWCEESTKALIADAKALQQRHEEHERRLEEIIRSQASTPPLQDDDKEEEEAHPPSPAAASSSTSSPPPAASSSSSSSTPQARRSHDPVVQDLASIYQWIGV